MSKEKKGLVFQVFLYLGDGILRFFIEEIYFIFEFLVKDIYFRRDIWNQNIFVSESGARVRLRRSFCIILDIA